jgi:hypothetical protein
MQRNHVEDASRAAAKGGGPGLCTYLDIVNFWTLYSCFTYFIITLIYFSLLIIFYDSPLGVHGGLTLKLLKRQF